MTMTQLLDNVFWHSLAGSHAGFAAGTEDARRYTRGFSPILGFADPAHPNFAGLTPYCEAGETFYCAGWSGAAPAGWHIDLEGTMFCMVWTGEMPATDEAPAARRLGPEHAAQAVALAALTRPGPFGPRTLELGEYFGHFEDGELVAMAGERTCAGRFREISGVCTHPEFQGRGLARRLMRKLIRRQMLRGETPFLHVLGSNRVARDLYRRMGFCEYREVVVRVVQPC
jgi:GNAT superfamily N-acetyltransferase